MQNILLKQKGLYTFQNALSELPVGAMTIANNVVIDRDGIAESRRGFPLYGNSMSAVAKQLVTYKNRIIRHFSNTLEFDSDGNGTFAAFTGSYSEPTSGIRIRSQEMNGNLYFTSSNGIQKISSTSGAAIAAGDISLAGGIKALDTQLNLNNQAGFFTQDSVVGYRVVWGIKDKNNNLVLGSPSQEVIIYNPITNLLIRDFNNLLSILDTCNLPGGIHYGSYVSSFKVTNNDPSALRTNLIAVANQIDQDTVVSNAHALSSASITSNVATLIFAGDMSGFLQTNDTILLSGMPVALSALNGQFLVTSVSTTTVTFSVTTANVVSTATPSATVRRIAYSLIPTPAQPSINPTTADLLALQTYYSNIVSGTSGTIPTTTTSYQVYGLQNELAGIVATPSIFNGSNPTTSSTVRVTFTVPENVTTSHFYQIYRTALSVSSGAVYLFDLSPGDEQALVYEGNPTSTQLSTRQITVNDIVPDSFRGAYLYTNEQSGTGIASAYEPPPFATDLALYQNTLFFANTRSKYNLTLNLLSVSKFTSNTSTFTISDGTTTTTYTFAAPVKQVTRVATVPDISGSLAGKYWTIEAPQSVASYYVWYKVGGVGSDPAITGKTGIEVDIPTNASQNSIAQATLAALYTVSDFTYVQLGNVITITNTASGVVVNAPSANTSGFTVSVTTTGLGEDSVNKKILLSDAATPGQEVTETAQSIVRVINKQVGEIVSAYYLSGPEDVPGQIFLQAKNLNQSAFYLTCSNTATGSQFNPVLPTSGQTVIATNDVSPNRLYYSVLQQPDAVPLLNYYEVGPKDKSIKRILALRNSLFIIKEEAIYRLSGFPGAFTTALFDSSTFITAVDSAAVLSNQIYFLSQQGVVSISETNTTIVSRPIENLLNVLNTTAHTNYRTATFGVGYESDRSFLLFTVNQTTDTYATQCFRYNIFTQTWTNWPISKTCGVVNPSDDRLYLGASDVNSLEQERKSFDRTDYADREFTFTLAPGAVNGSLITLSSVTNVSVNDVISQVQYLTIDQYNQLLMKLDNDHGLNQKNYYSSLKASAGSNLRTLLTSLATKLDSDSGIITHTYVSSISAYTSSFSDTQAAFNVIVGLLNVDTGTSYKNYQVSSGTTNYEVVITAVNSATNVVTTKFAYPFIIGPVKTYQHIDVLIQYAPQYFQDSSLLKQVSEASLIFEVDSFTDCSLGFATDLSPGFDTQTFQGSGNGTFGTNAFGTGSFGGASNSIPFRTYPSLEKQRCRYMNCQFQHHTAREIFSLYGLSLTYRPISVRAYR